MKTLTLATLAIAIAALGLAGCSSPSNDSTASNGKSSTTAPEPAKKAFSDLVLTDDEAAKTPKTEFTKDTAKIWVFFSLDVPSGTKIEGKWICEKSDAAPANFEIDKAALDIGMGVNTGNFSLSKPNKGWPAGDYRVDLCVGDKVEESVKFTVK